MTEPPQGAVTWRPGRIARVSADDAQVWLFGPPGPVRLSGRGAGPLARAVDGSRSLVQIVAVAHEAGMNADDAERIASRWVESGHLVPASAAPEPRTQSPRVRVVDRSGREQFSGLLERAGLDVATAPDIEAGSGILTVLVVDDLVQAESELPAELSGPVVAVQLPGERALVSPLLGAGLSCPACLASRLRARRVPEFVAARQIGLDVPPTPEAQDDARGVLACGVVAAAARAWTDAGGGDAWSRTLTVIDPATARIDRHVLVPVPGCPRCDPEGRVVMASHLAGTPAARPESVAVEDGGLRARDPDETWAQYAHLIGDVVGLVPFVEPTGRPELRAFSAGPNPAATADPALLRSRLRSSAGGKGLTWSAARTGALAEALERTSLRARGGEPSRRARMADLPHAVHPNDIQLFSEDQLRRAEVLRALEIDDPATSGFHRVPARFDVDAEHDWSPVADLRTGEQHWLPSSLVWFDWPGLPPHYPSGSSNGAAAGNTVHEALLQGLLERVERDSVALWWHPRCHRPAFDLDAWEDPRIAAALAPQRALGTDVWVLDVTSDLGIPAAAAVAVGLDPMPSVPLMGFGAHLDPAIAVVRALTELAQAQAPLTVAGDAVLLEALAPHEGSWFSEVTIDTEPWLAPHGVVPPPPSPAHRDIQDALDDAVARISARGLAVLWADCTRPEAPEATAIPLVPGTPLPPPTGDGAGVGAALSGFALLRRSDGAWVLESGRSPWQVTLQPAALGLLGDLPSEAAGDLRRLLRWAGMLEQPDDEAVALAWEPHDRYFASRSRSDVPRPGGYRLDDVCPAVPVQRDRSTTAARIALPVPSGPEPAEPTLWQATESRRSVREFADAPVPLPALGALLWRTLRVVELLPADDEVPYERMRRPVPSGGALHASDLWLLCSRVEGVPAGIWRYDAFTHELVGGPDDAASTAPLRMRNAGGGGAPVTGVITMRHARTSWKYAGIALSLELKDVGVILQALQVTAGAVGLGLCPWGSGPTRSVARALGVDPEVDMPLGEFALGIPADRPAAVIPGAR